MPYRRVLAQAVMAGVRALEPKRSLEHKKKGRLRCHRRPKSREETPKEGSDSGVWVGGRYRLSSG